MKYSIRIMRGGKFSAYLSHRGRKEWCKSQAYRHIADCKKLAHYQDSTFVLEES